jgi:hypothetical protein
VRFLLSSSFAALDVLKRCGAFLIVLMTFFTLGLIELSVVDLRRPLPPDSAIVGNVALLLLLRFNEPSRNERDNERESGLNLFNVNDDDDCDELGDDSATFLSSKFVTNLSSNAESILAVFGGKPLAFALDVPVVAFDGNVELLRTSVS